MPRGRENYFYMNNAFSLSKQAREALFALKKILSNKSFNNEEVLSLLYGYMLNWAESYRLNYTRLYSLIEYWSKVLVSDNCIIRQYYNEMYTKCENFGHENWAYMI